MITKYINLIEKHRIYDSKFLLLAIKGYFDLESVDETILLLKKFEEDDNKKYDYYRRAIIIIVTGLMNRYDLSDIISNKYPRATRNKYLKGLTYTLTCRGLI